MKNPKQLWENATPQRKQQAKWGSAIVAIMLALATLFKAKTPPAPVALKVTPTRTATFTSVPPTLTFTVGVPTATPTLTEAPTQTDTPAPTQTDTPGPTSTDTQTPLPTSTPGATFTPWPAAPLCLDSGEFHDTSLWHGPFNFAVGCHYDHEHGQNPFTPEVAAHFPGFDFKTLQGGVEVGHLNQSSPRENAWDGKHGGEKLQVDLNIPCESFEGSVNCIVDSILQYHWFGNMAVEMESRIHSIVAQERVCVIANPSDCGGFFGTQFVDLGQRVFQYQGELANYSVAAGCGSTVPSCQPNPEPAYLVGLLSYFTGDCIGTRVGCRASIAFILGANPTGHPLNVNGTWTSKGDDEIGSGSTTIQSLGRDRDMYQAKVDSDQDYPFTFYYVCSGVDPLVYVATACRYTNSTTRIHEVGGNFPMAWDSLDGVSDQHLSGQYFLTAFGQLSPGCLPGHSECFLFTFDHMPLGKYGGALPGSKVSNPTPISNPSRNIWFCNGLSCAETDTNAVPSGWLGPNN